MMSSVVGALRIFEFGLASRAAGKVFAALILLFLILVALSFASDLSLWDYTLSVRWVFADWWPILISSWFVCGGMLVLIVLASATAWQQVFLASGVWRQFQHIVFVPSVIPVFLYAQVFRESAVPISHISPVAQMAADWGWPAYLPLIVMCGNGLWFWWHLRFVGFLQQVQREKPAQGIRNLGLSVERYYVLPALRREIVSRLPEIYLWIVLNALFLEAGIPERSGILYRLVVSLSDGTTSVDWIGVGGVVVLLVVGWLLVSILSIVAGRHTLISGAQFFLIRGRLLAKRKPVPMLWAVPLAFCFSGALFTQEADRYGGYLFTVSSIFIVMMMAWAVGGRMVPKWSGRMGAVVQRLLWGGIAVVAIAVTVAAWNPFASGAGDSVLGQDEGGIGLPIPLGGAGFESESAFQTPPVSSEYFSSDISFLIESFVNTLWFFSISFCISFLFIMMLSYFVFECYYNYRNTKIWQFYLLFKKFLEWMAQMPPYFVLVVAAFWLGFQTFDHCVKQFYWSLFLFGALIPTQMLQVVGWIDTAAKARFLVARRSLGISARRTFLDLFRSRWIGFLAGTGAFAFGMVILMDMSMFWVIGRAFVCSGKHWLDFIGTGSGLLPWEARLTWAVYPFVMFATMIVLPRFALKGSDGTGL